MQRLSSAVALAIFVLATGGLASARPIVSLKLTGYVITRDSHGAEALVPLAGTQVHPGEHVRWTISATNTGNSPALHLVTPDAIPANTVYVADSARGPVKPEFSIDGGKSWSPRPTVTVATATGRIVKPAPSTTYTNVRWMQDSALAPKETAAYSFEVIVK